jgi:hypothetical protein
MPSRVDRRSFSEVRRQRQRVGSGGLKRPCSEATRVDDRRRLCGVAGCMPGWALWGTRRRLLPLALLRWALVRIEFLRGGGSVSGCGPRLPPLQRRPARWPQGLWGGRSRMAGGAVPARGPLRGGLRGALRAVAWTGCVRGRAPAPAPARVPQLAARAGTIRPPLRRCCRRQPRLGLVSAGFSWHAHQRSTLPSLRSVGGLWPSFPGSAPS